METLTYNVIIPTLVFFSVFAIGASLILANRQKKAMLGIKLQDSRLVELPQKQKAKADILRFLAKIGNFVSHGNTSKTLSEQLLRAGYIKSTASPIYTGTKILLFLLVLVIMMFMLMPTGLSGMAKTTTILLVAMVFFFLPNAIVGIQLRKRRKEVRQHLPDAVDLLEICVSSGIGLDMAWRIVSEEIRQVSAVLANAMSLTNFEINLGVSRVDAMKNMAERTGVEELSSLATILIQTERFGTSIADTLKVFAVSLREERGFAAEENAEKMAIKLIFPMVLFIFPSIIVIVAGPALITLLSSKFGSS